MTSKKNSKDKENDTEPIIKKEVRAYKYSAKGTTSLYEAIVVQGEPHFITWSQIKEKFTSKPQIEEASRIIRPPSAEEYPYTPYEFADDAELNDYFKRATGTTMDELYHTSKSFYEKYVDQDKNIIVILSADSILTYFQDLFPTIHYSEGIGGNDAGKSSIGFTFAYTGYRAVRGTSISGANYYRILGNVEPGQCTIIEDEADNISEDPDKVKILKAGYELDTRVPKTNMNTKNQEMNWFYPYCYKMILAEKSLSVWKAKGLVDRTFTYQCRPGTVRYSIKKVVSQTINKSPELERLYNELLDFRKLMLCYRLIHYTDDLPQIKTSVRNRDEELSSPLLQLFYGKAAFEEIKEAVEFFLTQRKRRRSRSLEAALYPILKDLINTETKSHIVNILFSTIWTKITAEHAIKGNLYSDNQYETMEYGSLYQNTLSKFIGDKFSVHLKHSENGSIITFDKEKFGAYDEVYNHQAEMSDVKIDVELVVDRPNPDGTEGNEGSSDAFYNFESENDDEKSNNNKEEPSVSENMEEVNTNPSPEPSEPSEPSAFPPKYSVSEHENPSPKPSPPMKTITCPKCGEEFEPYWFKHHNCDCD